MKIKNPKGAGRKRKFDTKELLKIIDKYKQSGLMKGKISYSEIAEFAQIQLGYNDLRYYHISADKEVAKLIEEYNNTFSTFTGFFSQKGIENSISNINVLEFINTHYSNKQKLIMYLENYKKTYDMTIKELLSLESENKNIKKELEEVYKKNQELIDRNKILRDENKILKYDYKILSKKVSEIGQRDLVDSLKSTGLVLEVEKEDKIEVDISMLDENSGANIDDFLNKFPQLFSE